MRKILSTLTLVLLVLIVGAGLYFSFLDPYMSRVIQMRVGDLMQTSSVSGELENVTYLLSPVNGGGIYRNGELTFEDYFANGSIVVDVVVFNSGTARLIHNVTTDTHDVIVNDKTILSSKLIKKSLFASEDGSRIAVAEKELEGLVTDPESWKVVIMDLVSGEAWNLDAFGAVFIDNETVLAFRDEGIVAVDYMSGEEEVYLELPSIITHTSLAQVDGKVAWTTVDGRAEVFEVIRDAEVPMVKITSLNDIFGTIALSDKNLYELEQIPSGGTRIIRHGLYSNDEAEEVRSLPATLAIKKLIP